MPEKKLVDLSHTIQDGLITYKGLPAPLVCDFLSREASRTHYEAGTEFHIARIDMVANTGTYIDCPFHRFADGEDFEQIGLGQLVDLEGIVIRVPYTETKAITEEHLKPFELEGRAVLFHTGWDRKWNTDAYFEDHPYLTEGAALYLREQGVSLAGIDALNIDNTRKRTRPVHTILLGADILIVEHLCHLELLPNEGFCFSAVPPKFKGIGSFPVRAMAKINDI